MIDVVAGLTLTAFPPLLLAFFLSPVAESVVLVAEEPPLP